MAKLLPHHKTILLSLDEHTRPFGEYCVGFNPLVKSTGMRRGEVRRIVRHLARRGYAEFHRSLWDEDGMPAGAGYCITIEGRAALEDK